MNILQRLNEVRKAVSYIQKDGRITRGGDYAVVTHDAVTAAVRDHLVDNGVIVAPTLVSSRYTDTGTTTANGVPIKLYEATYDISFCNCDDPQDRLTMRMESHALDQGDKAPGKAISYATKYALLKVFSIETGESEEERIPAKTKKPGSISGSITPTTGVWELVPRERHEALQRIGSGVIDCFSALQPETAFKYLQEQNLTNDEKVAVWTMLDSKMRSALKRIQKEELEKANATTRE